MMVDQMDPPGAAPQDEGAPTEETPTGPTADARFRDWMTQLQAMIDGVTTAAAPHVREIAAKAAELAAKAGDAAGPFAKRAAEATSDVGHKVAAKSRDFAADMRRAAEGDGHAPDEAPDSLPAAIEAAEPIVETPFTGPSTEA
jgi:hypothetical protein